jgi:xanthine dehydrogenase YagS FAD-binding subunit
MRPFEHVDATSLDEAVSLLQSEPGSALIAGGTDILVLMKEGLLAPHLLINIKKTNGLDQIQERQQGGLGVGALVTMSQLTESQYIRDRYHILVQAMHVAASPQLRNVATVAGNLCQHSRCWYYRSSIDCFLKGGESCHVRDGLSQDASVFGADVCYAVNPSDLVPVLAALDASVILYGPTGRRELNVSDFFVSRPLSTAAGVASLNSLAADEMIVEIILPPTQPISAGVYLKAMERKTWCFAQASVAIQISRDQESISDIRIVLGSVAPVPWRATAAEDALRARALTPDLIELASSAAVSSAQPLAQNAYKIDLIRALVKKGLLMLYQQDR